jgi:uncharacterized protein YllA (UPF0747 family)
MEIQVVEDIPVRQLPHQTKLFLDYVEFSPDVMAFYAAPPDFTTLERLARGGLPDVRLPRKEISSILRGQNERVGAGDRTLAHVADLAKDDAVAIVTGQQVGLFGGPLYTIYKSLTCIRLAQQLRE